MPLGQDANIFFRNSVEIGMIYLLKMDGVTAAFFPYADAEQERGAGFQHKNGGPGGRRTGPAKEIDKNSFPASILIGEDGDEIIAAQGAKYAAYRHSQLDDSQIHIMTDLLDQVIHQAVALTARDSGQGKALLPDGGAEELPIAKMPAQADSPQPPLLGLLQ